jgi:hypothetical protein
VEILSKNNLKILRSDNGGKYTSDDLKTLCREDGIKREIITSYDNPQNGVEEIKKCSIMEAVKAMIHDQYLPMHL